MVSCVVEREVNWTSQGELHAFHFETGGHHYGWCCSSQFRRECLYLVGLHAHNPELNLSLVDAMAVQARIREVIQPVYGEWLEVEASPKIVDRQPPNVRWLGWLWILTGAVWAGLICLLVAD